ncbi:DnaJ domain containing protein, expressed [Zostera marina]|uniref:DnaJ domain containing protein, expressed n=1 Tax=Zostera marina TaxID=29655 RepID=A0A0K9PIJ1_ZOSMR|nr:DnaJ domain containing protein, expressed [Zostera marina]
MAGGSRKEFVDGTKDSPRRLKDLAEEKYNSSDINSALKFAKKAQRLSPKLDGIAQMVTALRVLRIMPTDHYGTLRLEPFSNSNSIKKQYKSLALILHPDKSNKSTSSFLGAEEAFKRIAESFRTLSDGILKRQYDTRLRMELEEKNRGLLPMDTFWTACGTCRVFHEFDRKYLQQKLMCPGCRKSFIAVEVEVDDAIDDSVEDECDDADADEVTPRVVEKSSPRVRVPRSRRKSRTVKSFIADDTIENSIDDADELTPMVLKKSNSGSRILRSRKRSRDVSDNDEFGILAEEEDEMTLAEMQKEALMMKSNSKSNLGEAKKSHSRNMNRKTREEDVLNLMVMEDGGGRSRLGAVMAVEDSDFYDFDKDRTERSFKKGDVWAVYDDDDGMPRHYCLIDQVVSTKPFHLRILWLDLAGGVEETLVEWEKMGYHVSCGRFKVAVMGNKVGMRTLNSFSHIVPYERAARELYRIYPKKGSIWGLYGQPNGDIAGEGEKDGNKRSYEMVVVLTTYSDMHHGLSMGYLEKVEGFKNIFKRRDIGVNAVRWVEINDLRLFSHQIPAMKLSGMEGVILPEECWELDPASLP